MKLLPLYVVGVTMVIGGCDRLINRTPSAQGLGGAGGAGGGTGGGAGQGGTGGGATATGIPCEIQTLFVTYCSSCHGSPPTGGAPRSLLSYGDLTRTDLANFGLTEAQAALQRIQNKGSPMPPAPNRGPSSAEIASLQSWINDGYPTGSCGNGGTGGGPAAGGGGSGGGAGGSGGTAGAGQGGSGGTASGGAGGGTTVAATGLPCDLETLLETRCASCHGSNPSGGAPRSLVTFANLTAADLNDPSLTEAQMALQRMKSTTSPMPPAPSAPASSAEIAILDGWINSSYPKGTCGGGTGGSTQAGGSGGGGGSGGSGGGGSSTQPASGGSSGGSDAGVPGGTLPCDVQTLLVGRCDSCHGTSPSGGAPRSLVTYANLTAPDLSNPSMTEAEVAVQRMQSTSSPMPPAPGTPATSAEIATLQNWIKGGYPSGSCGGDAGAPPPDPLNAAPTCTSKVNWSGGEGSSMMDPGQACVTCHSRSSEAPKFVIAGTLYPTGHEPDNCYGVNGNTGAKVVVTGSNGTSITLTPTSDGNFYSSTSLPPPYQAKVVTSAGRERIMSSTAPSGDCNSCHTQTGANSAPGRITLP